MMLTECGRQNKGSFQVVLMVKNPPVNAGDIRDAGSIPRLGKSPGGGNGDLLLAWRIPWTEEPGWLPFLGSQSQTRTKHLNEHKDIGALIP